MRDFNLLMDKSIVFLGKYDDDLCSLEGKVVNNKIEYKKNQQPKVIKQPIKGTDFEAYLLVGNVKPSLQLKNVIPKAKIIFFTFNLSRPETLVFLNEGWKPVIERIDKMNQLNQNKSSNTIKSSNQDNSSKQLRVLIGIYPSQGTVKYDFDEKIAYTINNLQCTKYYETRESKKTRKKITVKNPILTNLFEDFEDLLKDDGFGQDNKEHFDIKSTNNHSKKKNKSKGKKRSKKSKKKKDSDENSHNNSDEEEKKIENEEDEEVKEAIKETKEEEEEDNTPKENDDDDDSHIWDTDDSDEKEEDTTKAKKADDPISVVASDEIYDKEIKEEPNSNEKVKTFKDTNYLEYKIFMESGTASITGVTKDKEEIYVPLFVRCQGQKFDVTAVDERAFSGSKLKALLFSEDSKLETIRDFAFAGSSIEELFIPSGVTALSANWCSGADKLTKIEVGPGNRFFSIRDGLLISEKLVNDGQEKRKSREILFAPRDIGGDFSIPAGITRIGNCSFGKREGLVSVASDTPSLQTIDSHAFSGCRNLERLKVCRASDLALCESCFSDSAKLSSVEIESEELNIGEESFSNCKSLQRVSLTEADNIVLNSNAFGGCTNLSDFTVNENNDRDQATLKMYFVDSIFVYPECFRDCTSLTSIVLSEVKKITLYSQSFKGCDNLGSLAIYKSEIIKIDKECFAESKLRTLKFASKSISFGENFIKDCSLLQSLNVDCDNDVTILSGTFEGCNSMNSVSVHTEATLKLCTNCFLSMPLMSVELKCDVLKIVDYDCFNGCSKLTNISFHTKHKTKFASNMFQGCFTLNSLVIMCESSLYLDKGFMNESSKLQVVTIKGKKILINDDCFKNCSNLAYLVLNNSGQIQVGKRLFQNCNKLDTITIQTAGNNKFEAAYKIFPELTNLQRIDFIGGQVEINNCKFQDFSWLTSVIFDKVNIVHIYESQFYKCKFLQKVIIDSLSDITLDDYAFMECNNLQTVRLQAAGNLVIGKYCFHDAVNLKSVDIHGNEVTANDFSFNNCKHMPILLLQNSNKVVLKKNSFCGCENIVKIEITANQLFYTGEYCFSGCKSLKDFIVQSDKVSLGDFCFNKCYSLLKASCDSANEISYYTTSFNGLKNIEFSFNPEANRIIKDQKSSNKNCSIC